MSGYTDRYCANQRFTLKRFIFWVELPKTELSIHRHNPGGAGSSLSVLLASLPPPSPPRDIQVQSLGSTNLPGSLPFGKCFECFLDLPQEGAQRCKLCLPEGLKVGLEFPPQRVPASNYPQALPLSLLQLSSLRHLTRVTKSQLRELKSRDTVFDASNNFI